MKLRVDREVESKSEEESGSGASSPEPVLLVGVEPFGRQYPQQRPQVMQASMKARIGTR